MSPATSKDGAKKVMDLKGIKEPMKKRRVGIKLIENREALHTTFTKRRQGLFRKASQFCENFAAQALVITFSCSGNVYAYGDPEFDPLFKRYLADPSSSVAATDNSVNGGGIMVATPNESEERINEALGKGRSAWDAVTADLGLSELDDMETAVNFMKSQLKTETSLQN